MANRRKDKRNAEIIRLFDNGFGMLQKDIAAKFDMKEKTVSAVICRERAKVTKVEVVGK